jgi:hypothetical protein
MPVVFADANGREWEVYQVRRTSHTPGAVSPGREAGWLAFTTATERRRLSAFPVNWETLGPADLAALCETADVVPRADTMPERRRIPRVIGTVDPPAPDSSGSVVREPGEAMTPSDELQRLIVTAATEARASGITVINALMTLRTTLAASGIDASSETFRDARRRFLDAFYFTKP